MATDWSPAPIVWVPPAAGNYRIGMWVRSANSNDNSGNMNISVPVVVR